MQGQQLPKENNPHRCCKIQFTLIMNGIFFKENVNLL